MKTKDFFEKKSVVATFGILSLLGGFYFLNSSILTGRVTGNYALDNYRIFDMVSVIALLLIVCSAILIIYAIVKTE